VAGSPSRVQPTNAVAAGAGTRRLDHGGRCRNHPTASVRTDAARTAGADIL
jgi:carbamoylphosphate synthase small subunit